MRKTMSIVSIAGVLCGAFGGPSDVSQADIQSTDAAIVVDDTIDSTAISLAWDFDFQSFALAVNDQPVLDAVTVIDEAGSPVLLGWWVDGSPTLTVDFGIDAATGNLLVNWHVEGESAIRLQVADGIVVTTEVCRCSATGPTIAVCKGKKDCEDFVSCGTGKICQLRYSDSVEMIPLE